MIKSAKKFARYLHMKKSVFADAVRGMGYRQFV